MGPTFDRTGTAEYVADMARQLAEMAAEIGNHESAFLLLKAAEVADKAVLFFSTSCGPTDENLPT